MEVACNDDDRFDGNLLDVGNRSTVEFDVVAEQTYFVFVDAFFENDVGNYVLSSSLGACAANVPPVCIDNEDCPFSNVCRNNACEFFCEVDDACGARELCQQGACVEVDCRVDAHCPNGVCTEDNTCVQCEEGADCAELECDGGACVCSANACVQCGADADCAAGFCEVNAGQCVDCLVSDQCADGQICFENGCVEQPDGGGICEEPIQYVLGDVLVGSIVDGIARDTATGCGGAGAGLEKVHSFSVDADGPVCLQTRGSAFDTVIYVRDTACTGPDANEAACNDNSPRFAGAFQSALSFEAVAGTEYFIFVDAFFAGIPEGTERYVLTSRAGACEGDPIPVCAVGADCESGFCAEGECTPPPPPAMPAAGDLVITELMFDPHNGLSDDDAEFIEIMNISDGVLDVSSCTVVDGAANSDPSGLGLQELAAGELVLLAKSNDGAANGGLMANGVFGFALNNGGDIVTLTCDDVAIDVVDYGLAGYPDAQAASIMRSAPIDGANPGPGNWCVSTDAYFQGEEGANLGTPGVVNGECQVMILPPDDDQ
jgi:hypothetical protein